MGELIKTVKREIYRLPCRVMALVTLIVTLMVLVMVYPVYLCSLLSRKNKRPIDPPKEMTYDDIEHQFCEYMFVRKLFIHKYIDLKTTCRQMGVTPQGFTEYLRERLGTTFSEVVHDYRIEEAKELWEKLGKTPTSEIARAVGYGNSMAFLYHFIRRERCVPHVWKKRNLS